MIKNRLKSITKYINNTDLVIDIGCDHALLDIYLIKNNILDKIIISDISPNALKQGVDNIDKYNLSNKIFPRLGNGLDALTEKDNIDTIIISGMGSNTILNILNNANIKKINKLVIQSNKDYFILRKTIIKLGYYIEKEEAITESDKLYINIIFKRGKRNYTEIELKYGIKTMKNKNIYYNYLIEKNNVILTKLENKSLKYKELLKENTIINNLKNES